MSTGRDPDRWHGVVVVAALCVVVLVTPIGDLPTRTVVGVAGAALAVLLLVLYVVALAVGAWWRLQLARRTRAERRGDAPPCVPPVVPDTGPSRPHHARPHYGWVTAPTIRLQGTGSDAVLADDVAAFDRLRCHAVMVRRGRRVNGASIPRWAWWLIGGPWSTPLQRASVVHDAEWADRVSSSWTVHGRFYRLAMADGCPALLAAWAWVAVVLAGGAWRAAPHPITET